MLRRWQRLSGWLEVAKEVALEVATEVAAALGVAAALEVANLIAPVGNVLRDLLT